MLRDFLNLAGIVPDEYALYDGCGLSRHDLASPRSLVRLLRYAARQTWGPEFIDSLPLAGSGRHAGVAPAEYARRGQSACQDRPARARERALGYVTNVAGRRLVFSILSNNHTLSGKRADEIIDEIVTEAQRSRISHIRQIGSAPRSRLSACRTEMRDTLALHSRDTLTAC